MSTHARELIAFIDHAEREIAFWLKHDDCMTLAERKRIRQGDYAPLVRPVETCVSGWIQVAPRLEVLVERAEIRRGKWRSRISHIRDFRAPHSSSPPGKRTRESLDDVTTLAGASGSIGEPERMEGVELLPSSVAARYRHEQAQREARAAHEALPLAERVRRLELVGGERIGRQLARIEQAAEAAERKLRRHGVDTSDRAA
jgi:hypothetical protein